MRVAAVFLRFVEARFLNFSYAFEDSSSSDHSILRPALRLPLPEAREVFAREVFASAAAVVVAASSSVADPSEGIVMTSIRGQI